MTVKMTCALCGEQFETQVYCDPENGPSERDGEPDQTICDVCCANAQAEAYAELDAAWAKVVSGEITKEQFNELMYGEVTQ